MQTYKIIGSIMVATSVIGLVAQNYVLREKLDQADVTISNQYAALAKEQTYHAPTVSQCEAGVTLAVKAMAVYDWDNAEAAKRAYEISRGQSVVIRQTTIWAQQRIESAHRMSGYSKANQLMIDLFEKGLKQSCQKQKLS